MKAIVKYSPKHIVELFDGEKFFIDSSYHDLFTRKCEDSKFIRIWDSMVSVSSIKKTYPAEEWLSMLESLMEWQSDSTKTKVRQTVREWKVNNPTKELTEWIIRNMIEKFS